MKLLKKYWLALLALALLLLSSFMIYQKLNPKELPSGLIQGVVKIDGDIPALNLKYPGRLSDIYIDNGDRVERGEVVARLESDEIEARLNRVKAEESAKRRELAAKKTELSIAIKTVPLAIQRADAALKSANSKIRQLGSQISTMREVVEQDRRDHARTEALYRKKLIEKEALEKSSLKLKSDLNRLEALQESKKEAEAAVVIAEAALKQAVAEQKKIEALKESLAALKDGIAAIEAAKAEVEAMLSEMRLCSPIEGYVVEKIANKGEVLGSGMAVATLIDPHSLYLKIFVDTMENGKIKIGDRAVIFLDAYPNRPIEAKVVRIAQKAEFTPKEVNVRSDRIQRVFAVHIKPLKVDPLLKLGIPATGVIAIGKAELPKSLDDLPAL
ncbi:MAG: HlyD family secretion protein [Hydrogenimonas sp.]|nr:HlyD family secretion protein [Hydrogenimonas sp.]